MQVKTEAILLKGTNYRDRSKIITLYTRSHGKMGMVAKGVRDVKSRWGGVLQSMAYLNVMFYYHENRSLHLITSADFVRSFQGIYDDFEKMKIGYRIIELINKTTEDGHENEKLFSLLADTLCNLNDATKNYVNLLFNFEFHLAEILGFAINLSDTSGILSTRGETLAGEYYHKPVLTKGDIKNIEAIAGGNLNALMSLSISKASEKTIDKFFDAYLRSHIENLSFSKAQKVINS
jgi:DNA repair protein RecO